MRELVDYYLSQKETTDILLSAQHGIWIDNGQGLHPVATTQVEEADLTELAVELIARGNRRLDPVQPYADVRLPGGIRVHAVLAPISVQGTVVSLRISRSENLTLEKLVETGFVSPAQLTTLQHAIGSQHNVLITGGAGAGKTTLLGALLGEVPHGERIVTIEDVAELRIQHPHHIALEARAANVENAGSITATDLLPQALRMRADRIAVGECRGPEWGSLLAAMNTGHAGGGTTIHANSLENVPARVQTLSYLSGIEPYLSTQLILGAFGLVVHVERRSSGRRVAAMGRFRQEKDSLHIETIHA